MPPMMFRKSPVILWIFSVESRLTGVAHGDTRHRPFEKIYPEMGFGGFSDVDGTVKFFVRVHALLDPNGRALDVGCGRGAYRDDNSTTRRDLRILKDKCRHVIGLDLDGAASANPYIDEFHLLGSPNARWPVEDASVQLIVCDHVMEHVENPQHLLDEAVRVLQPGGYLCVRTPNRWGYVALIATLVPNRVQKRVVGVAQSARKSEDVFPVQYRCNTRRRMRTMMADAGFRDVAVRPTESEPAYWAFSPRLFKVMTFVHRWTPSLLKNSLQGWARK